MALELGFFAIPVTNMDAARAFYHQVMGWSFEERDPSFTYINGDEGMIGALETATETFSPSHQGPKLYFRAQAMGAVMELVEAAGGSVAVPSTPIAGGERGYTAEVLDPSGNRIAFWAPDP